MGLVGVKVIKKDFIDSIKETIHRGTKGIYNGYQKAFPKRDRTQKTTSCLCQILPNL